MAWKLPLPSSLLLPFFLEYGLSEVLDQSTHSTPFLPPPFPLPILHYHPPPPWQSCCVALAGFQLAVILLPLSPKSWGYRRSPPPFLVSSHLLPGCVALHLQVGICWLYTAFCIPSARCSCRKQIHLKRKHCFTVGLAFMCSVECA